MASFQFYLSGEQIGTYSWASLQGNNDDAVVTLNGVQSLGSSTTIYRIVVTQANDGDFTLRNGQKVAIYTWSEENPEGTLVYGDLNPQHDMFQDRASGAQYQVFDGANPKIVFDLRGVGNGTTSYGQAPGESRFDQLPFSNLPKTPQELLPSVCFVTGTGILTPRGMVPVEALRPGDRVWTRGNGMQKIRWIGSGTACGYGARAPVRFEAGIHGNGRPVWLSQQHRVLISGWQAQLHFGEDEVLVSALHLVDGDRIRLDPRPVVKYWHIACDRHEIISAEGMLAESLLPGPLAISALSPAARDEIRSLFPHYFTEAGQSSCQIPQTARHCVSGHEARLLSTA